MKLTIICVGNKFDPHEEEWVSTYVSRIKKFCQVSFVKIKDSPDVWQQIQKAIPEKSYLVLLDEKGKSQTTAQLSSWFERTLQQKPNITFVIGGSFGFDDGQRGAADYLLSLSSMTLPHRIALLVFVEQLYRVLTIKAGHPYHHE